MLNWIHKYNHQVNLEDWTDRAKGTGKFAPWIFKCGGFDENNKIAVYQSEFPRYLTVAYTRSTEEESELTHLKTEIKEELKEQIKSETFQLKRDLDLITKLICSVEKKLPDSDPRLLSAGPPLLSQP